MSPLKETTTAEQPTTANGQKPRKLRLSCDNCHAAKVKCAKDHPVCTRCANLGATCVYSHSRRAGKPKGSGKNRQTSIASTTSVPHSLSSSVAPSTTGSDIDMDMNEEPWSPNFTMNPRYTDDLASQHAFGFLTPDSQSFGSGSGIDPKRISDPIEPTTFAPSMDFHVPTPQSLNNTTNTTTSTDATIPGLSADIFGSLACVTPKGTPCVNNPWDMSSLIADDINCAKDVPFPNAPFTPESSVIDSASPPCQHFCACASSLRETLSMLECHSVPFDRLLAVNKSAVNRVTQHLACRCPPDISSIMLLSVIITKIVQWYEKARHGNTHGSGDVGVTLGTFKMDSEDEYEVRMLLIRSELRKITALMSRFRERFERYLDGQDKKVYDANMTFLKQRLHDMTSTL